MRRKKLSGFTVCLRGKYLIVFYTDLKILIRSVFMPTRSNAVLKLKKLSETISLYHTIFSSIIYLCEFYIIYAIRLLYAQIRQQYVNQKYRQTEIKRDQYRLVYRYSL